MSGNGDGFALEVDALKVDAFRHQHHIAVTGGVNSYLNGGLVAGNIDGRLWLLPISGRKCPVQ